MKVSALRLTFLIASAAIAAPAGAQMFENLSDRLPQKPGIGHSMSAKTADINGDRIDDLLIAMERGENRLLLGDGKGGFSDASAILPRAARDSEDLALLDIDADGDLDIAVANEDDLLPELYRNDRDAGFADVSERIAHRVKANAVLAFDANADRIPDLFFGGDKVSSLWIGDGRGGFRDESVARLPATFGGTQDVVAADIDGDGDSDLILGNEDRNQIYVNDGSGRFAVAPAAALQRAAGPEETRDVEAFDADGDGDVDLFFANVRLWNPTAATPSRLLVNDGKGIFTEAVGAVPTIPDNVIAAQPIDLDGDGRLDLVTASVGDLRGANPVAAVRVLINMGGRFEDRTSSWMPADASALGFDVAPIDIDRDGKMDLFIAGRGGPDLLLRRK